MPHTSHHFDLKKVSVARKDLCLSDMKTALSRKTYETYQLSLAEYGLPILIQNMKYHLLSLDVSRHHLLQEVWMSSKFTARDLCPTSGLTSAMLQQVTVRSFPPKPKFSSSSSIHWSPIRFPNVNHGRMTPQIRWK